MSRPTPLAVDRAEVVRHFNRFYTRRIGVLHEGLLRTRFTLTESRLLWELAHRGSTTVTELSRDLNLDSGYLSRLLRGFKESGLIARARAPKDARNVLLSLTAAGRKAFAPLDDRSRSQIISVLSPLSEPQQQELLQSMGTIERLLDDAAAATARPAYVLRPHRPGDLGWVIARHGALYAQEYRWDMRFEALVARIAADFIDRFDREKETCWIAERDDANVGCVLLVQARDEKTSAPIDGVAQLRLLLVEPSARGLGIGSRLVAECERFARQAGYRKITLWTNDVLRAARRIYRDAGYRIERTEPHVSFGHALRAETWVLDLNQRKNK
jgi:DNA-binding MarR family transcriptional regulator/GNAT superfamily N-acetyltransferase